MTTTITKRMRQAADTSLNWTVQNPILLLGEIGFEYDTGQFKIGDGASTWGELSYAGGAGTGGIDGGIPDGAGFGDFDGGSP